MDERHDRTWLEQVKDEVRAGNLGPQASHIALVLAVHHMNGKGEAHPTQQTLAATTGLSRSSVQRGLRELEQHGMLERRHGPPAGRFGNVYRLSNGVPVTHLDQAKTNSKCVTEKHLAGSVRA